MNVQDVLHHKGSEVVTIGPDSRVHDAMRVLVEHNIGALVVQDGGALGILSERDVLRAAAADPQQLTRARVRELMTTPVITCRPHEELRTVMDTMSEHRIRHLPIVDEGRLLGIISIGDVVNALRQSAETENRYLHAYISGTPL